MKGVFQSALDRPADQRPAFVRRACKDDPDLCVQVEAMLGVHEQEDPLLDHRPGLAPERDDPIASVPAGTCIGRYRIVQPIKAGGMGEVYLAEQTSPVKRRVALKLIRPGMDSVEILARFDAERQTLALMSHPNIETILDAGTTDEGRPFFVTEYLPGLSLTEHCDRRRLSVEHRLALFVDVCEAVQHAHQRGIIHRDLKPSNILVVEQDGRALPKIIDFGVAKALTPDLTEATLMTQPGQVVGTPQYMSPEQAALGSADIDVRSDVYCLGVILYELVAGVLPFDPTTLRSSGLPGMQRILSEEEAPRPSTRLSALDDEAHDIARRRATRVEDLLARQGAGGTLPVGGGAGRRRAQLLARSAAASRA
ncbi:MAG: serine/threonine-protein kinase [Planctomycetota bacterium]|jgi:serine/threonine protein kinase